VERAELLLHVDLDVFPSRSTLAASRKIEPA
jgi:hypothetical protein